MATRNVHSKIDLNSVAELLRLGRFEEAVHIFGIIDITEKLLPYRIVK